MPLCTVVVRLSGLQNEKKYEYSCNRHGNGCLPIHAMAHLSVFTIRRDCSGSHATGYCMRVAANSFFRVQQPFFQQEMEKTLVRFRTSRPHQLTYSRIANLLGQINLNSRIAAGTMAFGESEKLNNIKGLDRLKRFGQ